MTVAAELPVRTARRILRDAVRDHRYENTELGPWVKRFLLWAESERGLSPTTLDDYERTYARMCIDHADRLLEEVTIDDLRATIATFPVRSRHKITATIRSFWKWAYLEEYIARDPAARLMSPKKREPLTYDIFSEDEEAKLITLGPDQELHHAVFVRDLALIMLLLRTGIRNGELRNLRVEDIDLTERWVIVRKGKGGKGRVVPYAKDARLGGVLEEFMLTELPIVNRPPERHELLFWGYHADNVRGGINEVLTVNPLAPSGAQGWWKRLVGRSGVRYRKMHMCRHTVATKLVQSGAPLVVIQRMLGHADIKTTIGYTHVQVGDMVAALEQLERHRVNDLSERA